MNKTKRKAMESGGDNRSSGPWGRSREDAVLAGVCSGLARTTPLSAVAWRFLFLGALLVFGVGVLAYLVLWVVMPRDPKPVTPVPPFFRRVDWWTGLVTTLIVLAGYLYTLAPDLTLEDSGELAVGSFYAGVPHPPGYPLWTIYTWLFTVLLPFSNIAWRVAVSSAVAAALSCGLVALITSRGSSMILESLEELRGLERRWESALCMVGGYVAGMLVGFNGFMWSQAVIVEVYTLSVLSFTLVLATLMRWIYAPSQRRYLYWSLFLFGVCFTNHQTLIVAAMGIEVAIAAANPRLGRDLFALNSVFFLLGLVAKANGQVTAFEANGPLYAIFVTIGVGSIAAYVFLAFQTGKAIENTAFVGVCMGLFWILGVSLYFFMPIASMTNPPMNWGYARTWEGFLHALTRGQYERANPTSDVGRFIEQLGMLLDGAVDEFNLVYLLVAFIPFVLFRRLQRRERAWLLGVVAMYLCLAVLLIVLLNPTGDRQSLDLNRVFFTASHVMIALCVGYGLAIFGGFAATQYERIRPWAVYAGAVASAMALYAMTVTFARDHDSLLANWAFRGLAPSWDPLVRFTSVFGLLLALTGTGIFLVARKRAPLGALVGLCAVMPFTSILSHWSDNEQRGHLFGYWFGHDMFAPPFDLYPSMAQDAILFGGTDPGRFCPTYMIFCESFIPPRCKPLDPDFDRRDVYIITQNALADQTYLSYIRAHYFRSDQKDAPFFRGMIAGLQERLMDPKQVDLRYSGKPHTTNGLARAFGRLATVVKPFDDFFTAIGDRVEAQRRAEGVYPPQEIYTPSLEDHGRCMADYYSDANRRRQLNQLRPGEFVQMGADGKLQVSGQVAVMAINALLTKVIFDRNPTNEFYVEESFPLDWMFPHLEPYGIIMKINREPLRELTEAMVQRDHDFWSRYSERLIGDWIGYDTSVAELCDFAIRTYERKDYEGFQGDRKFVRDDQAQKSFSKLRSSLGGLYSWRVNAATDAADRQRMFREAEFALKQSFAFCPYSPEAVYRYTSLLVSSGRINEAEMVAETCLRFDRDNQGVQELLKNIRGYRSGLPAAVAAPAEAPTGERLAEIEAQYNAAPSNGVLAFEVASLYLRLKRTNDAFDLLDRLSDRPDTDANTLLSVANVFAQMGEGIRLERILKKLVEVNPESPEAWYDLASTEAFLGREQEAMIHLRKAIELSDAMRATNSALADLRKEAAFHRAFTRLRDRPEFKAMVGPVATN